MHNLPFNTLNIFGDELKTLEDICNTLQNKFGITTADDFGIDVKKFDCVNCNANADLNGEIFVNGCYLALMYIANQTYTRYQSYVSGNQLWAFVKLKKDFGRILIRKETLTEKVIELIHPIEIDFPDDKHFSDKFYVVTNDKNKATLAMNWNFRDALMDMHDDWMVEIVNNHLLVYNNRAMDVDEAVQMVEFAGKIASLR